LAEREEKERALSPERAHKQVLTVKNNMHLILNSSTGTHVTSDLSQLPFLKWSPSSQWPSPAIACGLKWNGTCRLSKRR